MTSKAQADLKVRNFFQQHNPIHQRIIRILQNPYRDPKQNSELAEYLLTLEYFQKFKIQSYKDLLDVAGVLTYVSIPARTQVFDFGELGDAVYILLDGVVDVLKPLEKTEQTSFRGAFELANLAHFKASHGERAQRQNLWKRMDEAGHEAIKQVEKDLQPVAPVVARQGTSYSLKEQYEGKDVDSLDGSSSCSRSSDVHIEIQDIMEDIQFAKPLSSSDNDVGSQSSKEGVDGLGIQSPKPVEQTPMPDYTSPLINKQKQKRLTKQVTLQKEPRKSMIPGKLHSLDEGVSRTALAKTKYNPNKVLERRQTQKVRAPATLPMSGDVEEDVKSLDSDEERCKLVDDRNPQDKHFFCQKQNMAVNRVRIIEDYLQRHALPAIPSGVSSNQVDMLMNLHLFLYHRLPDDINMEQLTRETLKAIKQRSQGEAPGRRKARKAEENKLKFVMRFVHCYGRGQSFGGAALLKDGANSKKRRIARTITVTDSHFIVVSAENFKHLEKFERRLIEEKINFLSNLHFFKTWSKTRCKNMLFEMPQLTLFKGAEPIKEGSRNDFCYIIIRGEFQVRKKIPAERPNNDQNYKEFLQGVTAKRSIRGIFNNRITSLTQKRNLTTDNKLLKEEDIFTLSEGQIFGEERFVEMAIQKDQLARRSKAVGKHEDAEQECTSPFTIRCLSPKAEIFKIPNLDLQAILRKDRATKNSIFMNYNQKLGYLRDKQNNMNMQFKFATNLAPPYEEIENNLQERSLSPNLITQPTEPAATRNDKSDMTKCLMKQNIEFREKMREIVKDFPSMRTEFGGNNFDKTIGDQLLGLTKECLESFEGDEEVTDKQQVINQFQKYLKVRCGPPDDTINPRATTTEQNLRGAVSEMVKKKFQKAEVKRGASQQQQEVPAQAELAKVPVFSVQTKQPYISSKILSAYKAVKDTQANKMVRKQQRYNRGLAQQDEVVIDETKRPIQESRMDKLNRATNSNVIPFEMLNFELDTKSSIIASGRASNTLYNSSERVPPVQNSPQRKVTNAVSQVRYSTQNIRQPFIQNYVPTTDVVSMSGSAEFKKKQRPGTGIQVASQELLTSLSPKSYEAENLKTVQNVWTKRTGSQDTATKTLSVAQRQKLASSGFMQRLSPALSPSTCTANNLDPNQDLNRTQNIPRHVKSRFRLQSCHALRRTPQANFYTAAKAKYESPRNLCTQVSTKHQPSLSQDNLPPSAKTTSRQTRVVTCSLNYGANGYSMAAKANLFSYRQSNIPTKYVPVAKTFKLRHKQHMRNFSQNKRQ